MSNEVESRIIAILNKQLSELAGKEIEIEDELINLGINSVEFIKAIIALEKEFDLDLEDEDLDFNRFKVVGDLVSYIKEKV
ncbi:MAG: phosphopantetheine-binding protein [Clostridia bacterium]|nr:phosphopantetheine-binding protein [Clostridia bacterium]